LEDSNRIIGSFYPGVQSWLRLDDEPVVFWPRAVPKRTRTKEPKSSTTEDDAELSDSSVDDYGGSGDEGDPKKKNKGDARFGDDTAWFEEMKLLLGMWGDEVNPVRDPDPDPDHPPEKDKPKPKKDQPKDKGKSGPKYQHFYVHDAEGRLVGFILKNDNASQFDAHCDVHGPTCRIAHSFEAYTGTGAMTDLRSSKGRCLAFLVARLRLATKFKPGPDGRAAHFGARTCKGAGACLADGRGAERLSARAWVEAEPSFAPLRLAERQPRVGEPIEPPGRM